MTYPKSDAAFHDEKIDVVQRQKDGEYMITCNGISLHVGATVPIVPKAGMIARMYGKGRGLGMLVRGLYIDGHRFWYRTSREDQAYRLEQLYGASVEEWLKRWDEGRGVWSIEMGGIGPGYEQCLQTVAAEIVRYLLSRKPDINNSATFKAEYHKIEDAILENKVVKNLQPSGAQVGAAMNLAANLYRYGPVKMMTDPEVKHRHIQISNDFFNRKAAS